MLHHGVHGIISDRLVLHGSNVTRAAYVTTCTNVAPIIRIVSATQCCPDLKMRFENAKLQDPGPVFPHRIPRTGQRPLARSLLIWPSRDRRSPSRCCRPTGSRAKTSSGWTLTSSSTSCSSTDSRNRVQPALASRIRGAESVWTNLCGTTFCFRDVHPFEGKDLLRLKAPNSPFSIADWPC